MLNQSGTKRDSVWCQINLEFEITIQTWCDLMTFRIDLSVCTAVVVRHSNTGVYYNE